MRSRYFRYLFENLDEGLMHSGCIHDKAAMKTVNYIYMAGNYSKENVDGEVYFKRIQNEMIPEEVDILVLGSYAFAYLERLIHIVQKYQVKTIVMPYLFPVWRQGLVEYIKRQDACTEEIIEFMQEPYAFLKKYSIENIYFVYGNGNTISGISDSQADGHYFEELDAETKAEVIEAEGYDVPVVKAGHIIENRWLFMFGAYGQEMDNFGVFPMATIAMFVDALDASPIENDSFMVEKEFNREERCKAWVYQKKDNNCTCVMQCMHDKDHDIMQHHKNKMRNAPRFGFLMLGNVNLSKYFEEIDARFLSILNTRIRGIVVPDCGSKKDWNKDILKLSSAQERIYWICTQQKKTSSKVISDIVLSSINNRFLRVDEQMGCCFSGYIVPKEDSLS